MEVADGVLAGHEEQSPGWAALIQAASPSLRLDRAAECGPTDVTTRLGGLPLVDTGFVWPQTDAGQPLSLIGELNCDEVNAAAGRNVLPGGALLSFFYEAGEQAGWGFDPADSQYWRVVRTDTTAARPAVVPDGAITFPSRAAALRQVLTVPEARELPIHDLWVADRAGVIAMYNDLERLSTNAAGQETDPGAIRPRHRTFGWPDLMQNPMQVECQLVSHGIYTGDGKGYRDPRAEELRSGAADWTLLWQIDTDRELGWMWGDAGTIYYWIRRQDLASGAFERTWMMLQSG
jgi:uncharacterized protein YwqG